MVLVVMPYKVTLTYSVGKCLQYDHSDKSVTEGRDTFVCSLLLN